MSEQKRSIVVKLAEKYSVDPAGLHDTLKATCFKSDPKKPPVTNEQLMALLIVADQYNLNPFTKEIYAYPTRGGGIAPLVSIDGWIRIINDHPDYKGMEFVYSDTFITMPGSKPAHEWIEVVVHRKGDSFPIRIREYLDEVFRPTDPWRTTTKRMLRHKTIIQAARAAFGFGGIYDADDAKTIAETSYGVTQEPVVEVITDVVEQPKLVPLLEKLVARAIPEQSWVAAAEYIDGRYSGMEAAYAKQYLLDAEKALLDEAEREE